MARIDNLTNFLTDVASSIKVQTEDNTPIPASQFDTKILGIQKGKLSNEEYAEANNDLDDIFEGVIIPNTYQQIEYIQLSGTQYIDTNYALWANTNWKIEYKFDVDEFYNYNNMIGALETSNSSNEIWITSDGNYYLRFTDVGRTLLEILELNTPYTIIHDNTGTNLLNYVNGELVQTSNKANTSLNYKLGLGHREGAKYLKGKIYYAKFWNGNELVRNFVPVIRKSDNEIGLYDLVTNEFYMNAGTGSFIAGGNVDILNTKIKNILEEKNIKALPENIKNGVSVFGITGTYVGNLTDTEYAKANNNLDNILYQSENVLPDTYQEVEYLESTGTQYIDTNFTPNINTKAYAEFYVSTIPCGLYSSDSGASLSTNFSSYISGSGKWRFGSGVATVSISNNSFYTSFQDSSGITINGTNFYDYDTTISDFTSTKTITLLRTNTVGFKGKIYKFKLYDGNNIVRNFVPCYRKSDNEAGMYDTVNNVFYTNQGTGNFIIGVTENALLNEYQEVEYLESTGTQYIDTGYTFTNPNFKIELKYQKNTSLATNVFGVDTRVAPRQMHGNIYNRTFYLGNSSVVNNVTQELNTDYDYTVIFNENGAYFKLNENEYSYTGTTAWNGASLSDYLFTSHQTEAGGTLYNMKGRIYYARFYNENNVMVRNFIPCYRKSDDKPGMYDTVNNVFYTNEGTEEFIVGADVDVLNRKIERILNEKTMNIKPENIKSGVEILGVVGTYTGN